MAAKDTLIERGNASCELCQSNEGLDAYTVGPKAGDYIEEQVLTCEKCMSQVNDESAELDVTHWRCLNDSMWNSEPAVQVVAFRMLERLKSEVWAQELKEMMYLDEETKSWAESGFFNETQLVHKDANGNVLTQGDTVVLIKDLSVKGGGFTAKRGTPVRRITLDQNNPLYIEGRINDQHIVLLTEYVKKN